jgi:ferredoxin
MDAGHEKTGGLEKRDGLVSNKRQVQIARARTIGIKRRSVLPPLTSDCAAAQHDSRAFRDFLPDQAAELFESLVVAAKGEPQHIGPFLLFGESALERVTRLFRHQLGILPIFCVSSGAMAFIITDPCISTKDTACVDVCPVDCIHPRKDEPEFEQTPMLFIHPDECIDCGACVPACPVSAIYDSPDATPESQKDLIDANAKYRSGDPGAFAEATNIVNAHMSAHPELMNIPGTERAAAHQG